MPLEDPVDVKDPTHVMCLSSVPPKSKVECFLFFILLFSQQKCLMKPLKWSFFIIYYQLFMSSL